MPGQILQEHAVDAAPLDLDALDGCRRANALNEGVDALGVRYSFMCQHGL